MEKQVKQSVEDSAVPPPRRFPTAEDEENLRRELDAEVRGDVLKGKLLLAAIVVAALLGIAGTIAYLAALVHSPGNVGSGYQ